MLLCIVIAWRRGCLRNRCLYERGEEHPRCQFYQKAYQSMCPTEWVSKRMGAARCGAVAGARASVGRVCVCGIVILT